MSFNSKTQRENACSEVPLMRPSVQEKGLLILLYKARYQRCLYQANYKNLQDSTKYNLLNSSGYYLQILKNKSFIKVNFISYASKA